MPYNKFQVIENIKHYMRDKPIKRRPGFKSQGLVENTSLPYHIARAEKAIAGLDIAELDKGAQDKGYKDWNTLEKDTGQKARDIRKLIRIILKNNKGIYDPRLGKSAKKINKAVWDLGSAREQINIEIEDWIKSETKTIKSIDDLEDWKDDLKEKWKDKVKKFEAKLAPKLANLKVSLTDDRVKKYTTFTTQDGLPSLVGPETRVKLDYRRGGVDTFHPNKYRELFYELYFDKNPNVVKEAKDILKILSEPGGFNKKFYELETKHGGTQAWKLITQKGNTNRFLNTKILPKYFGADFVTYSKKVKPPTDVIGYVDEYIRNTLEDVGKARAAGVQLPDNDVLAKEALNKIRMDLNKTLYFLKDQWSRSGPLKKEFMEHWDFKARPGGGFNLNLEHMIPKWLIANGFAHPLEMLKVNITSEPFNTTKLKHFDGKLINLAKEYDKALSTGQNLEVRDIKGKINDLIKEYDTMSKGYLTRGGFKPVYDETGRLTFKTDVPTVNTKKIIASSAYVNLVNDGRIPPNVISTNGNIPIKVAEDATTKAGYGIDWDKVDLNKGAGEYARPSKIKSILKGTGRAASAVAAGATLPITYFGAYDRGLSPWDIFTTGTARLGEDIYNMLPLGKDVVDWASQYTLPAFLSGEDRKGFLEFMDRDREERGIGYSTRGQEFQAETLADYTPGELKKNITENFDPILHLGLKEGEGKFPSIEGTWFGFDGKGEKYDNLLQERIDQTLAERDYWQAKRLYENNPEMARAILEDYETTGFGNRETYDILQDMFKGTEETPTNGDSDIWTINVDPTKEDAVKYNMIGGYSGGGITTLDPRRPGALPPTRGPDPYGQNIKEGIVSLIK